jgi:DMSO reductase anchor subunit
MSREGFGLAMFSAGCGLTALFSLPLNETVVNLTLSFIEIDLTVLTQTLPLNNIIIGTGIFAVISGLAGLYYMNQCYQIKARPFWNHLQTATAFIGNTLSLGAMTSAIIILPTLYVMNIDLTQSLFVFSIVFILGMFTEALGLIKHNSDLNRNENEGGAAHYVQNTTFGKTYILRNTLLAINILFTCVLLSAQILNILEGNQFILWGLFAILNCVTSLIGRALFYILVIPTTMPGAFFWKNKGFEQHARDVGLADNPATGVAPLAH